MPETPEKETIPLVEETLSVGKRTVERGRVRVDVTVDEREVTVEADLRSDVVEVERVPVNRPVDAAPEIRREGDVLIVPVLEEELVVTKRLVLKEEVHLRIRTERRTEPITETLRSERAAVTRTDADKPDREEPENPEEPHG